MNWWGLKIGVLFIRRRARVFVALQYLMSVTLKSLPKLMEWEVSPQITVPFDMTFDINRPHSSIYLYKIQVCVLSVFLSVFLCFCLLPFFSQTDCPIALKFGMYTNWDIADVIAEPDFLISANFGENRRKSAIKKNWNFSNFFLFLIQANFSPSKIFCSRY